MRILDEARFDVIWSSDGWQTKHTAACRSLGNAGYSADIVPDGGQKSAGGQLSWTLHWPEQDRWLGYNVEIKIEAQ